MNRYSKENIPGGEWREYRKRGSTLMLWHPDPFEVETREGTLTMPEGGWLALDSGGFPYPIAQHDVQRTTYARVTGRLEALQKSLYNKEGEK